MWWGGEDMKRYVVGFAFTKSLTHVLLVEKTKPEWQKGFYNGIGGKIEDGETPIQAMNREAKEEAGFELDWQYKGYMEGINNDGSKFECHIFYAYDNRVFSYRQIENEPLKLMKFPLEIETPIINNLNYHLPYGACKDGSSFLKITY